MRCSVAMEPQALLPRGTSNVIGHARHLESRTVIREPMKIYTGLILKSHNKCFSQSDITCQLRKMPKNGQSKSLWREGEDALIMKTVQQFIHDNKLRAGSAASPGDSNVAVCFRCNPAGIPWRSITERLRNKTTKQIRERWLHRLDPMLKKGAWTGLEEAILFEVRKMYHNRWASLARFLPGRSENAVKNHFYSYSRRNIKIQQLFSEEDATTAQAYIQFLLSECTDTSNPRVCTCGDNSIEMFLCRRAHCSGPSKAASAAIPSSSEGSICFGDETMSTGNGLHVPSDPVPTKSQSDTWTAPAQSSPQQTSTNEQAPHATHRTTAARQSTSVFPKCSPLDPLLQMQLRHQQYACFLPAQAQVTPGNVGIPSFLPVHPRQYAFIAPKCSGSSNFVGMAGYGPAPPSLFEVMPSVHINPLVPPMVLQRAANRATMSAAPAKQHEPTKPLREAKGKNSGGLFNPILNIDCASSGSPVSPCSTQLPSSTKSQMHSPKDQWLLPSAFSSLPHGIVAHSKLNDKVQEAEQGAISFEDSEATNGENAHEWSCEASIFRSTANSVSLSCFDLGQALHTLPQPTPVTEQQHLGQHVPFRPQSVLSSGDLSLETGGCASAALLNTFLNSPITTPAQQEDTTQLPNGACTMHSISSDLFSSELSWLFGKEGQAASSPNITGEARDIHLFGGYGPPDGCQFSETVDVRGQHAPPVSTTEQSTRINRSCGKRKSQLSLVHLSERVLAWSPVGVASQSNKRVRR